MRKKCSDRTPLPPLPPLPVSKVVENETATAVCQKLLRIERPSHADLNKIISNSLVAALIPATTTAATTNTDTNAAAAAAASNASPMGGIGSSDGGGAWGGGGSGGEILHLGDKLAHLCPNRDFMFLQASMVPQVRSLKRVATSVLLENFCSSPCRTAIFLSSVVLMSLHHFHFFAWFLSFRHLHLPVIFRLVALGPNDPPDTGQIEGFYHQYLGGVSGEGSPDAHYGCRC